MPKVDIELRDALTIKQFKKDKQFQRDLERLAQLTDRIKKYEEELKGDEDEPGLRARVYERLSEVLPSGEKTIKFVNHRFTTIESEPRRTLDKTKLLKYITPDKLEKCYVVGAKPRPTVQVSRLESEEGKVVRKVTRKMITGEDE